MTEWWTYRPEDFLLFSPRVYWRLFELHNAALWPLPVLILGAGLVAAWLVLWRPGPAARWVVPAFAIVWLLVAWLFLWNRYATINWAAVYVAPVFSLEGAALAVAPLRLLQRDWVGSVLLVVGLVAYPCLAPLQGRSWASAEIFGTAPDPTAIATLGVLLCASGRFKPWLFPIPVLWCLISGGTLLTMGEPQGWVPLAALVFVGATGMIQYKQAGAS